MFIVMNSEYLSNLEYASVDTKVLVNGRLLWGCLQLREHAKMRQGGKIFPRATTNLYYNVVIEITPGFLMNIVEIRAR